LRCVSDVERFAAELQWACDFPVGLCLCDAHTGVVRSSTQLGVAVNLNSCNSPDIPAVVVGSVLGSYSWRRVAAGSMRVDRRAGK
jgi:sorbitol-specific phosphotransferase system component IIBC